MGNQLLGVILPTDTCTVIEKNENDDLHAKAAVLHERLKARYGQQLNSNSSDKLEDCQVTQSPHVHIA